MDIELCIYYNIVTIWFLFIIQSINLPPSAHTITSSAHCNPLQPTTKHPVHIQCTYYSSHCIFSAHTTTAITYSVHILQQSLHLQCTHHSSHYIFSAHCNHVQLSAANLQCTLQPTATIYNHLHYNYTIQYTLQLH